MKVSEKTTALKPLPKTIILNNPPKKSKIRQNIPIGTSFTVTTILDNDTKEDDLFLLEIMQLDKELKNKYNSMSLSQNPKDILKNP